MNPLKMSNRNRRTFLDDYDNLAYRTATHDLSTRYLAEQSGVKTVMRDMVTDSFIMHYKDWQNIVFNPNAGGSWSKVLEKYYETDEFKKLNENVSSQPLFSKLATFNFLKKTFESARNRSRQSLAPKEAEDVQQNPGNFFNYLDQQGNGNPGRQAQKQIEEAIAAISRSAEEAAEETNGMAMTMNAFSHIGIPLLEFGDADDIRRMASNRIIVSMAKILKKLSTAEGGRNTVKPSPVRGVPVGVKMLQSWSEIPDILPTEMLNEDLLSYKIASRSVSVRERHTSISDYVIYLDKSGSMGGSMQYEDESVPKISFACACILAMASQLRRAGGKMALIPFESDVHEPITDFAEIVKMALFIRDGGGTNITKVLDDSLRYRDARVILVSDGIDSVSEESAKRAGQEGMSAVLLHTRSPVIEKHLKSTYIEKFKGNFLLEA